ncbi:MAG: hypothetical protein HY810_08660, partial [Candidatus Omnitrophica bacterium]|nr:hypothetical protein [Candidatus Omnitrophota bacterium]
MYILTFWKKRTFNRNEKFLTVGLCILVLLFYPDFIFAQESFLKTKVEKISATRQSSDERIKQVLRNLEIPEDIGFIKEVNVP